MLSSHNSLIVFCIQEIDPRLVSEKAVREVNGDRYTLYSKEGEGGKERHKQGDFRGKMGHV